MNLLSIEITMTSLEVVDLINKFREEEGNKGAVRHDNFMASIRKEIKSLENAGIKKDEYVDKQNQQRPYYILNYECINYLKNNSKHDISAYCYMLEKLGGDKVNLEILPATSTRKELLIDKILLAWFDKEQIYRQYPVLNYRLDYYIPDCNLIIEYDESSGHKNKEKDNKRMQEILEFLIQEWVNDPESDGYDVDRYISGKFKLNDIITVIRIEEFKEERGLNELFEFLTGDVKGASKLVNLNR